MIVQQILSSKPSQEITTISGNATVAEAASILSAKHIGALVVSEGDGNIEGMFSERDIVRELGKHGPACLGEHVKDIMTRDIVTCTPDDRAFAVLQKMTDGRFRHMPVIKDGKMVGLVSIGDAVQARLMEMAMENEALEGMIKGF
ncbi:MAG: CBS domain-containing protein [Alphaproteobacteria bacterium]|nr:CBS domain-containing protein [Alphaproteobacteria bacterium]